MQQNLPTKQCSSCKDKISVAEFLKHSQSADGYGYLCFNCRKAIAHKYYMEHRKIVLEKQKERYDTQNDEKRLKRRNIANKWVNNNRDRMRQLWRTHYYKHKEKIRIERQRDRKQNPQKYAMWAMERHAMKLRAIPKWANKKYIQLWYDLARRESQRTSQKCHVDHIVPLQSKIVCGLHCEDNMQILFASDNFKKHNRYCPT